MIRRFLLLLAATGVACTEVATDPNAVVALRFEGSAYPSIVVGDSLRDSLGVRQPLQVEALNFESDSVPGADIVFSSPDTNVRISPDGVVYARSRKTDGSPVRVFATVGSLQSQPDSLFVVQRADSIKAGRDVQNIVMFPTGGVATADSLPFFVFGDTATATAAPAAPVPSWLVSYQLRYKGVWLAPNDTSFAFTFAPTNTTPPGRRAVAIDTTDAQGKVGRSVFVRSLAAAVTEDTIFLVATIRTRVLDATPISVETTILLRRP